MSININLVLPLSDVAAMSQWLGLSFFFCSFSVTFDVLLMEYISMNWSCRLFRNTVAYSLMGYSFSELKWRLLLLQSFVLWIKYMQTKVDVCFQTYLVYPCAEWNFWELKLGLVYRITQRTFELLKTVYWVQRSIIYLLSELCSV